MGKHFDTLVELVNHHIDTNEGSEHLTSIKDYLTRLITKSVLFEFPLDSGDIRPQSGKDESEYSRYLLDYFEMSKQNGSFFLTPFNTTAVEDPTSVVILDSIGENKFITTSSRIIHEQTDKILEVAIGLVTVLDPDLNQSPKVIVEPKYNKILHFKKNKIVYVSTGREKGLPFALTQDIGTAAIAYLEEVIYIMDPANFIIQKENIQSIRQNEKYRRQNKFPKKLQKTIMRPHYTFLSEDETKAFLRRESKEPRPAHPVRGHWRTLMSDRFVNKQGQRVFIRQYFTGQGGIIDNNGWHYQIMVKESPTQIVPYNKC